MHDMAGVRRAADPGVGDPADRLRHPELVQLTALPGLSRNRLGLTVLALITLVLWGLILYGLYRLLS
jgi:hypothetical protein